MSAETDEQFIREAEQNLARVKSQPNPDPDLVKWYERRIDALKKSAKAWADAYGADAAHVSIRIISKENQNVI